MCVFSNHFREQCHLAVRYSTVFFCSTTNLKIIQLNFLLWNYNIIEKERSLCCIIRLGVLLATIEL